MNDIDAIFALYTEATQQPERSVDSRGNVYYKLNGKKHREDGPAVEVVDGSKEWYYNGKKHREDGPAVERANGEKVWWNHGALHRIGGPAYICPDGYAGWYENDTLHREDGPAIESPSGINSWAMHGYHFDSPDAWAKALLKYKGKPHDPAAVQEFLRPILQKQTKDLI